MGAILPYQYRLRCCGMPSHTPQTADLCFDCAMKVTPVDDPIAVAYRLRVAARAAAEAK